jgi:hypothetical protein
VDERVAAGRAAPLDGRRSAGRRRGGSAVGGS